MDNSYAGLVPTKSKNLETSFSIFSGILLENCKISLLEHSL